MVRDEPLTDDIFELFFARPLPPRSSLILGEHGRPEVRFADETGLRRGLAALAHAHGWLVREEVVVPSWGRIDLILKDDRTSVPHLIELKVELRKPAQVRRAFQQADGYGRWWAAEHGEACTAYLVAANHESAAVERTDRAYPEVRFMSVGDFMAWLGSAGNVVRRAMRAEYRRNRMRELLAVQEFAADEVARTGRALTVEVVEP